MSLGLAAAWLLVGAPAGVAASADTIAIQRLVDRFAAARSAFDRAALDATLAPDYEEISPIGDVDERAKVLDFYRAADRQPVPAMQSSDRRVVLRGTTGIETERLGIVMPRPDGSTVTRSMRVRYVAMRGKDGWKLVSAQYTPIQPAR